MKEVVMEDYWSIDVDYRYKESPKGNVDGQMERTASTVQEYFDKAKDAIETIQSRGDIPVYVRVVHCQKTQKQMSVSEFGNIYSMHEGLKPKPQ